MAVEEADMAYFGFGLWTPARARVTMGWGCGSGAGEDADTSELAPGDVAVVEVVAGSAGVCDAVGIPCDRGAVREDRP
jgi:hypothetical protein